MATAMIGGFMQGESPLTAVQMLWVNLIMDTFAALALATEPPTDGLLFEKPHSRDDKILNPAMIRFIVCQSAYQLIVLLLLLFAGPAIFGVLPQGEGLWTPEKGVHYTLIFNTFVFMQVFNEINARKLKPDEWNVFENFFNNGLFLFILLFTIFIQVVLVQYGGATFKTSPLNAEQHIACIVIGAFSLIIGLLSRLVPVHLFGKVEVKQHHMTEEEAGKRFNAKFRKSFRDSIAKKGVVKVKDLGFDNTKFEN